MNIAQKLAILEFERSFTKLHREFTDGKFASGFSIHLVNKPEQLNLDHVLLSDILELDFDELYDNDEHNINCQILYTDFLKHIGFNWWNLGDSLTDIIYEFTSGDQEINEENLILLEIKVKRLYLNYLRIVSRELPPKIPQGGNDG